MEVLEVHLLAFSCQNWICLLRGDLIAAAFQEFLWWPVSWRDEDGGVSGAFHLTYYGGMEVSRDFPPSNKSNSMSTPPNTRVLVTVM